MVVVEEEYGQYGDHGQTENEDECPKPGTAATLGPLYPDGLSRFRLAVAGRTMALPCRLRGGIGGNGRPGRHDAVAYPAGQGGGIGTGGRVGGEAVGDEGAQAWIADGGVVELQCRVVLELLAGGYFVKGEEAGGKFVGGDAEREDVTLGVGKTVLAARRELLRRGVGECEVGPALGARDNADALAQAKKALEVRVKDEAKLIKQYVCPPNTTPFAIMYLATEGLYAQIISSKTGIAEALQAQGIMVAGPSTVTALLNSLAMGFKTVAINKKANEVYKVLGAAKAQYDKFGIVLAKARKKVEEAGKTLEDAEKRNDIIQKKLKGVETLETDTASEILSIENE